MNLRRGDIHLVVQRSGKKLVGEPGNSPRTIAIVASQPAAGVVQTPVLVLGLLDLGHGLRISGLEG